MDPLFKKAAADFDEGGAKGLLLNNLAIDAHGRITFDSSDEQQDPSNPTDDATLDAQDDDKDDERAEMEGEKGVGTTADIDIASLGAKFFPDLNRLDEQDVCPSLKDFSFADGTGDLDIPFLRARQDDPTHASKPANLDERSGIVLDDGMAAGFDDDEDGLGGFELPPDTGFGEGGEAWARDASIVLHVPVGAHGEGAENDHENGDEGGHVEVGGYDGQNTDYIVAMNRGGTEGAGHDDILSYFDDALQKNWAGPEHWRIRKIKDTTKAAAPAAPKPRKEKEPFAIDFLAPLDPKLATAIYTPAASTAAISLPKTQWKSKTRNLLPDDKHFNSRQLVQLFLKPKARLRTRRKASGGAPPGLRAGPSGPTMGPDGDVDEAYWAQDAALPADEDVQGNYDANFFQDDGLAFPGGLPDDDDDDFVDAREAFPGKDGADGMAGDSNQPTGASQDGGYGAQLVTQGRRMRPEYVQYARVAKKVDVRRLKDEMWRGMGLEPDPTPVSNPLPYHVHTLRY